MSAALIAGALLCLASAPVRAQGAPPVSRVPTPGSARPTGDSAATGADSLTAKRAKPLTADDTIKAPITAAFVPAAFGARLGTKRWNRDEIFAAGALTLGELIAQVPGVMMMSGGFMLAPTILAWHGDPAGIRLVIDGVERPELSPRNGGVTDFAMVPVWVFEEISLEETPGELRVHARTWRVDRTTASSRADILTGSENLNLFRGFFGKRSAQGVAIQLAAQQLSTISRNGMDGDGLGAFLRLGWAAGDWSVDATGIRQGINRNAGDRNVIAGTFVRDAVPALHGSASTGYLRAGWRRPDRDGFWAQFVAASSDSRKTNASNSNSGIGSTPVASDSGDTTASQAQYLAAAGLTRGGLRLNAQLRATATGGAFDMAPLARAEYSRGVFQFAGAAGTRPGGSTLWDGRVQVVPLEWLRASASVGSSPPSGSSVPRISMAADVALQYRGAWLSGGVRRLGAGEVLAPVEFDTAAVPTRLAENTALSLSANVPVWRGWRAQTDVIQWQTVEVYRPKTEARSRLWFESSFLDKFPTGSFHLLAALTNEYRTPLSVPVSGATGLLTAEAYSILGALVEIRISNAVISWSFRNMAGSPYETHPGYIMPRNASVYGIRWQFWN